jgi:hypothetical protein
MAKDKIMYYSKYCKNCDKVIKILSRSSVKDYIHFLPIDKRINKNGKLSILLDSGESVLLPTSISRVPALLLIHQGNRVLFGDEIINFFREDFDKERKKASINNDEPLAYSFYGEMGTQMSDSYSYLDQNSDEMGVKGEGGLRPPEDYVKEKLDENTIKQYQQSRAAAAPPPKIPEEQNFSFN